MRLAILLTSGSDSRDPQTVYRLAETALTQGHQVTVFLMVEGIRHAPLLSGLSAKGARVMWCSLNARQRRLSPVPGIEESSQYEWSRVVAEADRVIGFT